VTSKDYDLHVYHQKKFVTAYIKLTYVYILYTYMFL